MPDAIEGLVSDVTGTERLLDLGWNVCGYIAHMSDNTRIWADGLLRSHEEPMHMSFPMTLTSSLRQGTTTEIALQGATWSFRIAVSTLASCR